MVVECRQGTRRLGGEWWWLNMWARHTEVRRRVVVVGCGR